MKATTLLPLLAVGGAALAMRAKKQKADDSEYLNQDRYFPLNGLGMRFVEIRSTGGFDGVGELVRRVRKPGLAHRREMLFMSQRAARVRYRNRTRGRHVWDRSANATGRRQFAGLGSLGGTIQATQYKVKMRANGVAADAPKTPYVDRAYWQKQLNGAGFSNVTVNSIRFLGSENPSGFWTDSPTSDYLFELDITVPKAPGSGVADYVDNVVSVLRRIGQFVSRVIDVAIVKVTKVRDVVIETARQGIEIVPKTLASAGSKYLLVAGAVIAGLVYVAGKSKTKTAYATFGG